MPRDSERFIRELEQELESGSEQKRPSCNAFDLQEDNYDSTKVRFVL